MTDKFLRVAKSDFLMSLTNGDAVVKTIKQKKYVYIDFDDEKSVKVLQQSQPNDSEEQAQVIGSSYIASINKLSPKTFQMLRFLSETKHLQERRKSINKIVNKRIKNSSQSPTHNSMTFQQKALFSNRITYEKLEQYLQSSKNQRIIKKLQQGQRQLQRSISAASTYKKLIPTRLENRPPARGNRLPPLFRLRQALNA